MTELLLKTGVIGIVLALLALLAIGLIIERWIAYRRESTDMDSFMEDFEAALRADIARQPGVPPQNRRYDSSRDVCEQPEYAGCCPEVYRMAVEYHARGAASLRNILNNHIDLTVLPRLRVRLGFLSSIAKGAPMIGLLGTVYGMIGAFAKIGGQQGQGIDPKALAGDIGMALGTTFLGLIVAIPIVFAVAYLRAKVEQFEVDLERYSDYCLDLMYPHLSSTIAAASRGRPPATMAAPAPGPAPATTPSAAAAPSHAPPAPAAPPVTRT